VLVESQSTYHPVTEWSSLIKELGYDGGRDVKQVVLPQLREQTWNRQGAEEMSFRIGHCQGAAFSVYSSEDSPSASDSDLFPKNLPFNIRVRSYLHGLYQGLKVGAGLICLYRRSTVSLRRPGRVMRGAMFRLMRDLSEQEGLHVYMENHRFNGEISHRSGHLSARHPPQRMDTAVRLMDYFSYLYKKDDMAVDPLNKLTRKLLLFSDFRSARMTVLLAGGWAAGRVLSKTVVSGSDVPLLNTIKNCISHYCLKVGPTSDQVVQIEATIQRLTENVWWTKNTIRKAISELPKISGPQPFLTRPPKWGEYNTFKDSFISVQMVPESEDNVKARPPVPQISDPMIAGLRRVKVATSGYLKISTAVTFFKSKMFLCLGDGSGGMTALLLRRFPDSFGVFNSQLDMTGHHPQGVAPGPPAALMALPETVRSRCLNLNTTWEANTDLRYRSTWEQMGKLASDAGREVDMVVIDAEFRSELGQMKILENLIWLSEKYGSQDITIIVKTFWDQVRSPDYSPLYRVSPLFMKTELLFPLLGQSFSSECYVITWKKREKSEHFLAPDLDDILFAETEVRALKSIEKEFERALKIEPEDQKRGVPEELHIKGEIEVESLLSHLSVPDGLVGEVSVSAQRMMTGGSGAVSAGLFLIGMVSNSLLRTTSRVPKGWFAPSNSQISKLLAFSIGIQMILARRLKNLEWYRKLHDVCQSEVDFSYLLRKGQEGDGLVLYWTLFGDESYRVKSTGRFRKEELSVAVMRAFGSLVREKTGVEFKSEQADPEDMDMAFKEFSRNLTFSHLEAHTGSFYPLVMTKSPESHHPNCPVRKGEKLRQRQTEYAPEPHQESKGILE